MGFLLRRLAQTLLVMGAISVIGFALLDGLEPAVPAEHSIWQRYLQFAAAALRLDFGDSAFFHEPALDIVVRYLPATLELFMTSALLTLLLAIPLGVYTAIRPRGLLARCCLAGSAIGISMPVFLTAILLIQLFAIGVNVTPFPPGTDWGAWLNALLSTDGGMPAYGRGNPVHVWGSWYTNFSTWQGLGYLLLPASALASVMLPLFVRLIRAEMLEVLESDYVKFARAKGLSSARIYFVHALKNALLPVMTIGGMQFGTLAAYTLLTETVFQWPGLGLMFLDSIERSDIRLLVTYLMVMGGILVVTNVVIDLLYLWLDPRIQLNGRTP